MKEKIFILVLSALVFSGGLYFFSKESFPPQDQFEQEIQNILKEQNYERGQRLVKYFFDQEVEDFLFKAKLFYYDGLLSFILLKEQKVDQDCLAFYQSLQSSKIQFRNCLNNLSSYQGELKEEVKKFRSLSSSYLAKIMSFEKSSPCQAKIRKNKDSRRLYDKMVIENIKNRYEEKRRTNEQLR